jgi:hypothetical protein
MRLPLDKKSSIMNRFAIGILVMVTFLLSCKGCGRHFYAVHEDEEYLDIIFYDTTIKASSVIHYVDSVLRFDTANYEIHNSLMGVTLDKDQRVIYFKNPPKEYYEVSINAFPCWIMGVFNEKIDRYHWIYNKDKIKVGELERIKIRFKDEVLSKIPRKTLD